MLSVVGGSDYRGINASFLDVYLIFDNNNRRQSFSMAIVDDRLLEGTESFTLQLRSDPFSPLSSVRLSPDVSVVTIIDDDVPGIILSSSMYSIICKVTYRCNYCLILSFIVN